MRSGFVTAYDDCFFDAVAEYDAFTTPPRSGMAKLEESEATSYRLQAQGLGSWEHHAQGPEEGK